MKLSANYLLSDTFLAPFIDYLSYIETLILSDNDIAQIYSASNLLA